jgi:L-fuconate dehydratase
LLWLYKILAATCQTYDLRSLNIEGALEAITITNVRVIDLRFPTSRNAIGSDAVNKDPDYSSAYCILETDGKIEGHGSTFTLGRGTDLCVSAIEYLAKFVVGRTLDSIAFIYS